MKLPQNEAELRLFTRECTGLYAKVATGETSTPTFDRMMALQAEHDAKVALRKLLQRKYPQMTAAQIEREIISACQQ